jgi:hypothetical protein
MALTFVDTKSRGYRRLRPSVFHEAHPRYLLLVAILVAFFGGFLLGKNESTPATMANVFDRFSAMISREPELSVDFLLGKLAKARLELDESFRSQYGDYFGILFDPFQIQKNVFLASPTSRERLKRRMIQKILEKLLDPSKEVRFIWATAGDSSAAGHGNMFNQSYTAVLERSVQPAFQALGINFVGRNYGMMWYQSAPEVAFCMKEIYGDAGDLDVLNWDFSMQDGDANAYKTEMWVERAMVHPGLPVLFFVDKRSSTRLEMLKQKLDTNGVGFVFMDKMTIDVIRSRVPSNANSVAVKDWICPSGAVEGSLTCDDPIRFFVCDQRESAKNCLAAKYDTLPGCESGQISNHPGWKEHQFKGLLISHFILDVLEEALVTLDDLMHPNGPLSSVKSDVLIDRLKVLHQRDMKNATMSPIPSSYRGIDEDLMQRLTPSLVFRGNSVCHTALLPAQSRFLGHVTESGMIGSPDGGYDTGENKLTCKPEHNKLPLAYSSSDRLRCPSPKIDHKDFFYVRNQDGWLHSTVPTRAEVQAYQQNPPQGIIFVCLQVCPMDRCSDDYVGFGKSSDHGHAKISMKVDGKEVTSVINLDHGCHVLESDRGIRWGPGLDDDGRYKLSFRLHAKLSGLTYSVKVSSIVVM